MERNRNQSNSRFVHTGTDRTARTITIYISICTEGGGGGWVGGRRGEAFFFLNETDSLEKFEFVGNQSEIKLFQPQKSGF